jgi:hypothetical protein
MRLLRLVLPTFDPLVVEQAHHQTASHPDDELQGNDQAHPFVQPAYPGRHAVRLRLKL